MDLNELLVINKVSALLFLLNFSFTLSYFVLLSTLHCFA